MKKQKHLFVEDDIIAREDSMKLREKRLNTFNIKIANSQQVNTEDKGNTSPSPPSRKKRQPTEGGCVGDSLTPADTNSEFVQEASQ